jgi:hypothetical protein
MAVLVVLAVLAVVVVLEVLADDLKGPTVLSWAVAEEGEGSESEGSEDSNRRG